MVIWHLLREQRVFGEVAQEEDSSPGMGGWGADAAVRYGNQVLGRLNGSIYHCV